MVPGFEAPSTSTCMPTGSEAEVQPFVSVLLPVPEQWAAWPVYVFVPSLKMKLAVHWAPPVKVITPGWTAAEEAGAHAEAEPASASSPATATSAVTSIKRNLT